MIPKKMQDALQAWEPKWHPFAFKAVLWLIGASAIVFPLLILALPFYEFFNGMAAQPKGVTQSTYGRIFEAEDLVDRTPPEGSMARGVFPVGFEGNEEETAVAAGQALANPTPPTMTSLEQGQQLFDTICATCHGKWGEGDGGVVGPNRFPAPTNLHDPVVAAYPDGRLFHVISYGKGKMWGYADKIAPADRWHVVNYLRALQRAVNPEEEDFER